MSWIQCADVYQWNSSAVFCLKEKGHEGDHRGIRTQWNAKGHAVSITEPIPGNVPKSATRLKVGE